MGSEAAPKPSFQQRDGESPYSLCDEALYLGGRRHAEDAFLAKLDPQMLRVVLMRRTNTSEGLCPIERAEGIAMD